MLNQNKEVMQTGLIWRSATPGSAINLLLRISRGDATELPGFDNAYTPEGEFNLRSVEELISEFKLQRASTLALVNGIPPAAWPRVGTANGFRTSARALVYIILGHTAHHYRVLRARYRLPATQRRAATR